MKRKLKRRQFFILFIDVCLMFLSLVLALILRDGKLPPLAKLEVHFEYFLMIFLGWILVFYTFGLYRIDLRFDDFTYMKRLGISLLIVGMGTGLFFYILPNASIAPKTVLLLTIVIFGIALWTWRYLYGRIWAKNRKQRVGVGFIGYAGEVRQIIDTLNLQTPIGYDARFIVDLENKVEANSYDFLVQHDYSDLRDLVERTGSDLVILAHEQSLPPEVIRTLYGLLNIRVRFTSLSDFYELILRRVPIGAINETWFLENIDLKRQLPYEAFKRIIDLLLSALFCLVLIVLFPFIAVLIILGSPGPVFFVQTRVGRFGKPFTMIKFRTMREGGNHHTPTLADDDRITRFGRFLRASRLDELPQVINILKGDMSFIGPRPERPEYARLLAEAIPYYQQRHLVKPGVTGWDQVSGAYHSPSVEDTKIKLQYDLYYLKNISFSLDFSIFFKTILTILQRTGR